MAHGTEAWVLDTLSIDQFNDIELPEELCTPTTATTISTIDYTGSSLSSTEATPGSPSTGTTSTKSQKAENEEEAKRMRNRASVEKCRRKKRQRLGSLTNERAALTKENAILKKTTEETRMAMIEILHQVANLSGSGGGGGGGDSVVDEEKESY